MGDGNPYKSKRLQQSCIVIKILGHPVTTIFYQMLYEFGYGLDNIRISKGDLLSRSQPVLSACYQS